MALEFFSLDDLLSIIHLQQDEPYLFSGDSTQGGLSHVFGGQVLAQALYAASKTVPSDRQPHSLHGYFLRSGDPKKRITFDIDPIRDGKSFTTRRVVASQEDKAIFNISVSFQVPEKGLEHQFDMPEVPPPEELESEKDFMNKMDQRFPGQIKHAPNFFDAVDVKPCVRRNLLKPEAGEAVQNTWFRVNGRLPDDPMLHKVMLAYMSDMQLMGTALRAHPVSFISHNLQGASLDHGLWFHDEFRADEWLLYHMDSPRSSQSRGLNRGSIYTRDGRLIASTIQEGLIRLHDKPKAKS